MKKIFLVLCFVIFSLYSVDASANTNLDANAIRAEIAELQARISMLQTQLDTIVGTTPSCQFTSNLQLGSSGLEVTRLQNFLKSKGYFTGDISNYFGYQTQVALSNYQLAKGISPSSGYFGPLTREVVSSDCQNNNAQTPNQNPNSSIVLTSPNGGENYRVGDSIAMRWTSTNLPSSTSLYLQMQDRRYIHDGDIPRQYSPIPNYQIPIPNTGSYTWVIPETLGNGQMRLDGGNVYRISIGTENGSVVDWSNGNFSITNLSSQQTQINVTSQNSSSGIVTVGNNLTVSFDTSRTGTHSVFLVHSATGRATDLGTYNVSRTGANSFTRTLATSDNLTEGSYRTRVCYGYGNSVSSCDDSSSTLQIKSQTLNTLVTQERFVSVTNPNTGGSYEIGDSMNISWNHAGFPNDQKVTIALFKNGNHEKTIASNVAITDRSYPWVVPSGTYSEGNIYKIYVGATSVTGTRTDYSDTAFSIKNEPVKVVSPRAGAVLTRGAWYSVRLENVPENAGTIDVYVVSSNGTETKITTMQSNQASSYQWTVPATFTPDSNVKIKVYRQGTLLATSDSYSVVASAGETAVNKSLTVTLPSTTFTKPSYTDGIPVTYSWTSSYPVNRLWFQMIEKATGNIKNAGFAGSFETGAQSGSKTNNIPSDAVTGTYVFKLCDVTTGGVSATSICDTKEFTLNPPASPTSQTRENQLANIAESIKKLLEELKKVSR